MNKVLASSFADPADVRAFKRCKIRGGSDFECFKVGDNGVGKWGDLTSEGSGKSCALPPEEWEQFGLTARGKMVRIKYQGREVTCQLRDTMPHRKFIKNGAGIDLNPDTVRALGMEPPIMVTVEWEWV